MWPFSRKRSRDTRLPIDPAAPEAEAGPSVPAILDRDVTLTGNAPDHWPAVTMRAIYTGSPGMNNLLFSGGVAKALHGNEHWLYLERLTSRQMLEEGILEVPMTLREGEQSRDVFFYPEASLDNARRFAGLTRLYRELGRADPVYFCPERLHTAYPANPLRGFSFELLARHRGELPADDYCMWWPSGEGERFSESAARRYLDLAFERLPGLLPYVTAALLRSVERRDAQPGEAVDTALPVKGPDGNILVVRVDSGRGLRFLFPASRTDPVYRDRFLKHFAEHLEAWHRLIEDRGLPLDRREGSAARQWWQRTCAAADELEARGEHTERIGHLSADTAVDAAEGAVAKKTSDSR